MNITTKVIKIKCRQSLVNYKKPSSHVIKETYLLPPYSTVIGMIHNACSYTTYHPMNISIQGNPIATISDLYTYYTFKGSKFYEKDRHQFYYEYNGDKYGVSKGISNTELITYIDLVIHIEPLDEKDFDYVYNSLKKPAKFLSLGRNEDLLDITDISIQNCQNENDIEVINDMYVPVQFTEDITQGTVYKINKEFYIDDKSGLRIFKKPIEVQFVEKSQLLSNCLVDEEMTPLFLV